MCSRANVRTSWPATRIFRPAAAAARPQSCIVELEDQQAAAQRSVRRTGVAQQIDSGDLDVVDGRGARGVALAGLGEPPSDPAESGKRRFQLAELRVGISRRFGGHQRYARPRCAIRQTVTALAGSSTS